MAGIAFKEEIIALGSSHEILIDYSENNSVTDSLDFAQTFYLQHSLLICKVFTNALVLEQAFFCTAEDNPEKLVSIENAKRVRIVLPCKIVAQICVACNSDFFDVWAATESEKIFCFTFLQGWGFVDGKSFVSMQGFFVQGFFPNCFSLLRVNDSESEVCVGQSNGNIYFMTLPRETTSGYSFPLKITEVSPPTSILKTISQFVLKRNTFESVLRIANLEKNQIMTLSSNSALRLYRVNRPGLICELNLGLDLGRYFFAYMIGIDSRTVVVAHKSAFQWEVTYVKVSLNAFEVMGKFSEPWELTALAVNNSGIWATWNDGNKAKVSLYPLFHEKFAVFSVEDQFLANDCHDLNVAHSDPDTKKKYLLGRILLPGRFSKNVLKNALARVNGSVAVENFEDLARLERLDADELGILLENLKSNQWKDNEVLAVCACEEIGDFPCVVVRGAHNIGLMRAVRNEIESKSLYSKKVSLENFSLISNYCPESMNDFKISVNVTGIHKSLVMIRLWRQKHLGFLDDSCENFTKGLYTLINFSIPNHLLQALVRSFPASMFLDIKEEISALQGMLNEFPEKNLNVCLNYWPGFMLTLMGTCVTSMVTSIYEHCLDLSILVALLKFNLKAYCFEEIHDSDLAEILRITQALRAFSNVFNKPLKSIPNSQLAGVVKTFENFSFPISVSPIYFMTVSNKLFGEKNSFCLAELNPWISLCAEASVKEFLTVSDAQFTRVSTVIKVLAHYGQSLLVKEFFKDCETINAVTFYFEGNAKCRENQEKSAIADFLKGGALVESGNYENSYKSFIQGPWNFEMAFENTNFFNVYNKNASHLVTHPSSNKIVLADFVISSLSAAFNDEKIVNTVKNLAKIGSYFEAFTVIQSHTNKRIIKQCLLIILEKIVECSEFFIILQLPFNAFQKEIAFIYLEKKCIDEHFDLYKTLSNKKYYEKAGFLFLSTIPFEDRKPEAKPQVSWTRTLYCFSMNNQYFGKAAECVYRYACEVSDFCRDLKVNGSANHQEIAFLKEIMAEYLMLTALAVRNIHERRQECYFLVKNYVNKGKRKPENSIRNEEHTEIRKLVTLQEVEENLANILVNNS